MDAKTPESLRLAGLVQFCRSRAPRSRRHSLFVEPYDDYRTRNLPIYGAAMNDFYVTFTAEGRRTDGRTRRPMSRRPSVARDAGWALRMRLSRHFSGLRFLASKRSTLSLLRRRRNELYQRTLSSTRQERGNAGTLQEIPDKDLPGPEIRAGLATGER